MKIFVTSYTYIYERHIRVFDFFKKKDDLVFILPDVWKSKGGKLVDHPVLKPYGKLISTPAYFWHSHYPLIHGQLKGWMPRTGAILRRLAKPGDVLLTSMEPNMLVTYFNARIARRLGLKHVFMTWQNMKFRKLTEWLVHQNVRLSAGVLCGTERARQVFAPYVRSHLNVAVIPQSGVDTDLFKQSSRVTGGRVTFLFAAVFDERKGVITTVMAFRKTLESVPDAHLVMVGMGKLWEPAKALVRELGLQNHVEFISWMPNDRLPEIFAQSDILVHPSEPFGGWEEQYGWTILQAQSCGLPVIATKVGSIPEAVLAGKTGLLVEPKNVDALCDAMVELALNPQLRKDLGIAGRAYVEERFSHRAVAKRMEHFLRSL